MMEEDQEEQHALGELLMHDRPIASHHLIVVAVIFK
jgi:hypothetical protein